MINEIMRYRKLGYSFDDEAETLISYLSKLLKMVENNDENIVAFSQEINNYIRENDIKLSKLFENVSRETREKFQEFVETGYFDTKFDEILSNDSELVSKNEPRELSNVTRIFRKHYSDTYGYGQGFEIVDNYAYVSVIPFVNSSLKSNNSMIQKIDISTGEVIAQRTGAFGHSNSICAKDNYIYLVECYVYDSLGNTNQSRRIFKLNSTDLALVETISLPFSISSLTVYDSKFYALCGKTLTVYTDDFQFIEQFDLDITENFGTGQSLTVNKYGLFVLRYNPSHIINYDFQGHIKRILNIPEKSDNVYRIVEPEDLTIIDNLLYFSASCYTNNLKNQGTFEIYKCDLSKNSVYSNKMHNTSVNDAGASMYISRLNSNPNPDGTKSNPFATIQECINAIMYSSYNWVEVHFLEGGQYDGFRMNAVKMPVTLSNDSQNTVKIKGIYVLRSNLAIEDSSITINGVYNPTDLANIIVSTDSTVFIKEVNFENISNKYAMLVQNRGKLTSWGNGDNPIYVKNMGMLIQHNKNTNSNVTYDSEAFSTFPNRIKLWEGETTDGEIHLSHSLKLFPHILID